MASKEVRANTKGFDGHQLREAGERFMWPDGIPVGKWVDPIRFGGKGDHDGDGVDGGSKPVTTDSLPADFVLPADWRNLKAAERKALADKINGSGKVANAADADAVIEAYAEAHKPEAFGDAPAPQTVQDGIKDAGGGPAPDWVAPGHIETPVAVADDE